MKTPRKSGAYRLLVTMAIVIMLIIVLAEVVWIIRNSSSDGTPNLAPTFITSMAAKIRTDASSRMCSDSRLMENRERGIILSFYLK